MPIKTQKIQPKLAIIKFGDKSFNKEISKTLQEYTLVKAGRTENLGIDSYTSVRDGVTRLDYEKFRTAESIPTKPNEIIKVCRDVYRKVGLIRNILDLMADFGSQGITLNHPSRSVQRFFRGWFKKVDGARISERFLNLLYREGISVIKRTMGKVSDKMEKVLRSYGKLMPDQSFDDDRLETINTNIPIRYNFLNPLTLVPIAQEISQFVGKYAYAIKISQQIRDIVIRPKNTIEQNFITMMPKEFVKAIKDGVQEIPLDMSKLCVYHYKKDDWQTNGDPIIYAVLNDVFLLEKMKLADLCALDGAISQIRLWQLGDLEHEIFPTDAAASRLNEILLSNTGGGAFDIIWGPDLKLQPYETNVHQFLGKAKYEPVLDSIYAGLGIPPTLTGAATGAGFTNNYISLKTLVQRLEYGRMLLTQFWDQEINLVCQAMHFRQPAKVEFDRMILSDEAAEKALLIQLVDRDAISIETLLERFGEQPEFEELRIKKENEARESKDIAMKAGPYHQAQQTYELMKIALTKGLVTPEQAGIEIPVELQGQKTPFQMDLKAKTAQAKAAAEKMKGVVGQGRPKNSKDSKKRKTKTVKPVGGKVSRSSIDIEDTAAFMTTMMWAKGAYDSISSFILPAYLKSLNKKTARELSDNELKQIENIKFLVLSNLQPYCEINKKQINIAISSTNNIPLNYSNMYGHLYKFFVQQNNREPNLNELRNIEIYTYSIINSNKEFLDG